MKFLLLLLISISLFLPAGCTDKQPEYHGDLKNGKPHGTGVLVYPSGTVYEGEFNDGARCGSGVWEHPDGPQYSGTWLEDRYHGWGKLTVPGAYTYKGEWEKGVKQGRGIQTWEDGRRYEGTWYQGQKHGHGTMQYPDGSYYEGEWAEGQKDGEGTFISAEGKITTGTWENDQFIYVPVDQVTLCSYELELTLEDQPYQLEARAFPADATNPKMNWTSEDPQIAAIKDGLVTPLATGETTIKAVAGEQEAQAECLVTVTAPPQEIAVTRVSIDHFFIILDLDDEPQTLQAVVEPEDATDKTLIWQSSDPAVASVDQLGRVTPQGSGEAEITVETADGGYTDSCNVTVR